MEISTTGEFDKAVAGSGGAPNLVAVLFYSASHPPAMQMFELVPHLKGDFPSVSFYVVDCDVKAELLCKGEASHLPTMAFYCNGKKFAAVEGADPPKVLQTLKAMENQTANGSSDINERLKNLTRAAPVVLFMKGSKDSPFCKFSREAVGILNTIGVEYHAFDILKDEEVRQGLKDYSDFPTYPQLYIQGELIGGVDIMRSEAADGSLGKMLQEAAKGSNQENPTEK